MVRTELRCGTRLMAWCRAVGYVASMGRGRFVARPEQSDSHPEQLADQVTGFCRQQTEAGNIVTTRTLRQALVAATPDVSKALGIDVDGRVVQLAWLRNVNGRLHQLCCGVSSL